MRPHSLPDSAPVALSCHHDLLHGPTALYLLYSAYPSNPEMRMRHLCNINANALPSRNSPNVVHASPGGARCVEPSVRTTRLTNISLLQIPQTLESEPLNAHSRDLLPRCVAPLHKMISRFLSSSIRLQLHGTGMHYCFTPTDCGVIQQFRHRLNVQPS